MAADEPIETASDGASPPAASLPRFCKVCGGPWDAVAAACPACAARTHADDGVIAALPPPRHPIRAALLLYFSLLGTSLAAALALIFGPDDSAADREFLVEVGVALADAVLVLVWCLFSRRVVWPALAHSPRIGWYVAAALLAGVTWAVASTAVWAIKSIFPIPEITYFEPILRAGYGWTAAILLVGVQPAIIEELAFRGVILGALRSTLRDHEAVIVSAVIFAIIHLSIPSGPHLLVIGLVLGYLRVRTGSLYPGMILHFVHNLLCLIQEARDGVAA